MTLDLREKKVVVIGGKHFIVKEPTR